MSDLVKIDREYAHKILEALMDGEEVECKTAQGDWVKTGFIDVPALKNKLFRAKPKSAPLPIPKGFWESIDQKWKCAAMNKHGHIYLYTVAPRLHEVCCNWYTSACHDSVPISTILKIDTTGIDWRQSLTKRPEGV